MKEFDLSDKELKSLLQQEGIESPSMGFNQSILSKIDAYEKTKVMPVKVSKWLIFGFMIVFIAPAFFIFTKESWNLNSFFTDIEFPSFSFNFAFDTTYLWVGALTIGVVTMAMLFDRFLLTAENTSVKKG